VHGVLLLDKPEGLSSNAALVRARRALGTRKAGHTGTLDPLASGLLVICVGDATRWAGFGLGDRKTYIGTIALGERTATADREGDVVEVRPVPAAPWPLAAIADRFTGPQQQVPPMYSALKRDGRPLYAYARAGAEVERPARDIVIHALALEATGSAAIDFVVTCSAGTYVRTLAEDIGAALGTVAHLARLRRTALGDVGLDAAVALEAFEAADAAARRARLLPVDTLVQPLPPITLPAPVVDALVAGRPGQLPTAAPPDDRLHRAYGPDGGFLGLVQVAGRVVRVHRLMPTGGRTAEPAPAPSPEHATD
jgi:tRNA pseudouridine55 synthase